MMMLSEAAEMIQATRAGADVMFESVSIDTRTLQSGALFVALEGPNFNGHDFIPDAASRGAAAALVSQQVETALPTLRVADTRLALGRLAAGWREAYTQPMVAVTGSNGKTTVKEMLSSIFTFVAAGNSEHVLATRGNLNNDLGVPLTLLRLRPEHRYAVIEMGMNHAG